MYYSNTPYTHTHTYTYAHTVHVYTHRVGSVVTKGFREYYGQFVKGTSKCLRIERVHMAVYLQPLVRLGVHCVHVVSN